VFDLVKVPGLGMVRMQKDAFIAPRAAN
jgi:hypothetical protein